MSEKNCRGAFELGTACGKCPRCKRINAQNAIIDGAVNYTPKYTEADLQAAIEACTERCVEKFLTMEFAAKVGMTTVLKSNFIEAIRKAGLNTDKEGE